MKLHGDALYNEGRYGSLTESKLDAEVAVELLSCVVLFDNRRLE